MAQEARRRGATVRIRGERWRVGGETRHGRVSIVDVDGCDTTNANARARFLVPFDAVHLTGGHAQAPRIVSLAKWRRSARHILADAVPHWSALRAASRARLDVLPFQLEPALAMTRGDACRFLIADAVGLGKTIQAGLMIAETLARIGDARVLIVTPAGLREQWRDELASRFAITTAIVDAGSLARAAAQLAPDANPWAIHAIAISSVDYIKRPDVLRSLESLTWDVLVFDEAHALAGRSDRAAAAAALAERARVLVLLTATPHSGDDAAFERLCELGNLENGFPLRTFRRTRAEVGLPHGRRSRRLAVRLTADEAALHRALKEYVEQIVNNAGPDEGAAALVGSILERRACSSAFSLRRSLERRKALIGSRAATAGEQLRLPLFDSDSDDEPSDEVGGAWLPESANEIAWLARLIELARSASEDESKQRLLRRLLRRVDEPLIVFTEYRDTLHELRAALDECQPIELHGGLMPAERARVLRRFIDGSARVLIATDAASEGLNLHQRCRLVVNLEIPWTPLRLEQRIGRVDRLGQTRRVHAISLIASGTNEESRSARIDARSERIAAAFEHPAVVHRSLADASTAEAARLSASRALAGSAPSLSVSRPPVAVVTNEHVRRAIWAFHLSFITGAGEQLFESVAGLTDPRGHALLTAAVADRASAHHARMLDELVASIEPWLALTTIRERAIAAALARRHARLSAALLQPGLFDRRSDRAAAAQAILVDCALERSRVRASWLESLRHLEAGDRAIAFGLLYR